MNTEPHHPGDAKAAPDPAPYPTHWTPEQRVTAYWYALRNHAVPRTTHSWEALLTQAQANQHQHTDEPPNPENAEPELQLQTTPTDPDEPPY